MVPNQPLSDQDQIAVLSILLDAERAANRALRRQVAAFKKLADQLLDRGEAQAGGTGS
jgi:hypothetical protein